MNILNFFKRNKQRKALIKEARRSSDWDSNDIYDLILCKLKLVESTYSKFDIYEGQEIDHLNLKRCISLLERYISSENADYFHFDFPEEDCKKDINRYLKECQYHCDVYVNMRNVDRWVNEFVDNYINIRTSYFVDSRNKTMTYDEILQDTKKSCKDLSIRYPHELYSIKCLVLFWRIFTKNISRWSL